MNSPRAPHCALPASVLVYSPDVPPPPPDMRAQYTPPGLRAILAGLLGLLICFILFLRFPLSEQHWLTLLPERSAPPLYLLMPINEARARSDHNFCRAAKAALIQGYRPILYNWDFQANVWQTQGAKIPGMSA